MTKKNKIHLALGLFLIAVIIATIVVITISEAIDSTKQSLAFLAPPPTQVELSNLHSIEVSPTPTTEEALLYDESKPNPNNTKSPNTKTAQTFGRITIETDKKTKTYEIMKGIDEKTLKRNIGWLPSSSLPNKDGLCVLMGHRDTDFKILKHAKIGDSLTVTISDHEYNYTVFSIEIFESEQEITFPAMNGSCLTLVTCYPFRYTGQAPQKIILLAKRI